VYNVFDQTISLTPPLGGTAQAASYLGPNQDEIVTRGSDQYANNVLGIGIKVYSDATVSYFTRDENGAVLSERAPGGARYYFVPDGLGSTIATTGTGGAIVNSYKYDPYGGVVTETETSVRPTSFRFAGGLYSSSVGLHKFGARWYDQTLDRWTQQDSIDQTGDLQDGNRYLYAGDNPTNMTDPTGESYRVGDTPGPSINEQLYYYHQYLRSISGPPNIIGRCVLGATVGYGVSKGIENGLRAVGKAALEKVSGYGVAAGCIQGALNVGP
jgi:RHS repeat-associated protein